MRNANNADQQHNRIPRLSPLQTQIRLPSQFHPTLSSLLLGMPAEGIGHQPPEMRCLLYEVYREYGLEGQIRSIYH